MLNAVLNHGFAYYAYGVMSICAALFVWRFVPETKGRSLEQIQQSWQPQTLADVAVSAVRVPGAHVPGP